MRVWFLSSKWFNTAAFMGVGRQPQTESRRLASSRIKPYVRLWKTGYAVKISPQHNTAPTRKILKTGVIPSQFAWKPRTDCQRIIQRIARTQIRLPNVMKMKRAMIGVKHQPKQLNQHLAFYICKNHRDTSLIPFYTGLKDSETFNKGDKIAKTELLPGDAVMPDKGFLITEELDRMGIKLSQPPFLGKRRRLDESEVITTQTIASHRAHVEHAICKIRQFHFFDSRVPISMLQCFILSP